MQRYSDIDRDSGVVAFESGADYIRVRFADRSEYKYTCASAGSFHIEKMKVLAERGDGLNGYINEHVKKRYATRSRY